MSLAIVRIAWLFAISSACAAFLSSGKPSVADDAAYYAAANRHNKGAKHRSCESVNSAAHREKRQRQP